MPNLVELIKKAAVEAVEASNPMRIMYGTVLSSSPLSIKIDQKFTLTASFLVLTNNVRDHEVEVTVDWFTENEEDVEDESEERQFSSHNHAIKGKKKITIHNALKTGDRVILMQEQGGQRYIVLDKVGG